MDLNVISCNFVIFGAIFMQFSPKCNTKLDTGKLIIKFLSLFGTKQGPITGPKFGLGKSLQAINLKLCIDVISILNMCV